MRSQDTYGEPITLTLKGATVRVYRPILTEEERARRMKEIEKAAAALLISKYEGEKKREKGNSRLRAFADDRQ